MKKLLLITFLLLTLFGCSDNVNNAQTIEGIITDATIKTVTIKSDNVMYEFDRTDAKNSISKDSSFMIGQAIIVTYKGELDTENKLQSCKVTHLTIYNPKTSFSSISGTVCEKTSNSVIIEDSDGTKYNFNTEKPVSDLCDQTLAVGDTIEVTYQGDLQNTNKLSIVSIDLLDTKKTSE